MEKIYLHTLLHNLFTLKGNPFILFYTICFFLNFLKYSTCKNSKIKLSQNKYERFYIFYLSIILFKILDFKK